MFSLLLAVAVAGTPDLGADPASRIGVLASDGSTACVAVPHTKSVILGKLAMLRDARAMSGSGDGVIYADALMELAEPCAAIARTQLGGFFVRVSIEPSMLEPLMTIVLPVSDWDEISPSEMTAQFRNGPFVWFRECTSHEGLHFTAWSGEALSGTRIWHAYVYLGYDVEPTCTDAELE